MVSRSMVIACKGYHVGTEYCRRTRGRRVHVERTHERSRKEVPAYHAKQCYEPNSPYERRRTTILIKS